MCVIMICDEKRPSEEMVKKAYKSNGHGGGVAWREGTRGNKAVHWLKGLSEGDMIDQCATLPLPFIAHFRIASVGPQKFELCHPFPVSATASTELEGETKEFVLFHNGTWGKWRDSIMETALRLPGKQKLPTGIWSDTRAMAWMAHHYGLGVLEIIDEKAVAFGPEDMEIFTGNGWSKVEDIWCSNNYFQHNSMGNYNNNRASYIGMCKYGTCREKDVDFKGYCALHTDGKLQTPTTPDTSLVVTTIFKDDTSTFAEAGGTLHSTPFRNEGFSISEEGVEGGADQQEAVQEAVSDSAGTDADSSDRSLKDRLFGWAQGHNTKVYHTHTPVTMATPEEEAARLARRRALAAQGIHVMGAL